MDCDFPLLRTKKDCLSMPTEIQTAEPIQGDLYLCANSERVECTCGGLALYLHTPSLNGYWCVDCDAYDPDIPDMTEVEY